MELSHHINFLKTKPQFQSLKHQILFQNFYKESKVLERDFFFKLPYQHFKCTQALCPSPKPYQTPSSPALPKGGEIKKRPLPLVGSRIYSVIYFPANCSHCHCLWALVQKRRNEITDWPDRTQLPSHNPIISSFCHPH